MTVPKITLTAGNNPVEGRINGVFNITLDQPAPISGLTVIYNTVSSTATLGADYNLLPRTNVSQMTVNSFTSA